MDSNPRSTSWAAPHSTTSGAKAFRLTTDSRTRKPHAPPRVRAEDIGQELRLLLEGTLLFCLISAFHILPVQRVGAQEVLLSCFGSAIDAPLSRCRRGGGRRGLAPRSLSRARMAVLGRLSASLVLLLVLVVFFSLLLVACLPSASVVSFAHGRR